MHTLALVSATLHAAVLGSFWTYQDEAGDELARQQRVLTMPSTALVEWPDELDGETDAPCEWYNGTYVHEPSLCSHFAVQRLRAETVQQATQRALQCAAQWNTDCVLSVEIGFGVPAAFVYDAHEGVRMIVAPRPVPLDEEEAGGAVRVRVEDPREVDAPWVLEATRRLRAEFMAPPSRLLQTEVFEGADAYCVQALRHAVARRCWEALD